MKQTTGWEVSESEIASGGEFLTCTSPNSSPKITDHKISGTFKIKALGKHTVKWSMRQPDGVRGDQANDAWICFPDANQIARTDEIKGFHKFVGRSTGTFGINGQLDLEGDQPWMSVSFLKPGTYRVELAGKSHGFQLDRICLYSNLTFDEAKKHLSKTPHSGHPHTNSSEGLPSHPLQQKLRTRLVISLTHNRARLDPKCHDSGRSNKISLIPPAHPAPRNDQSRDEFFHGEVAHPE